MCRGVTPDGNRALQGGRGRPSPSILGYGDRSGKKRKTFGPSVQSLGRPEPEGRRVPFGPELGPSSLLGPPGPELGPPSPLGPPTSSPPDQSRPQFSPLRSPKFLLDPPRSDLRHSSPSDQRVPPGRPYPSCPVPWRKETNLRGKLLTCVGDQVCG